MEQQATISSRKRRIAAFVIDHFVMTFLLVALTFIVIGPNFLDEPNFGQMVSAMLPTMAVGMLLYFAKDSIKGISVGKWIMGIMVRDANAHDQVPSFGRLLVRNLFLVIWPIEFIVLATTPDKKRLGDKTSQTIVVHNPKKPTKPPRILALALVGAAFFVVTMLFAGQAMKSSDAYKVSIRAIEQNQEILDETGGITGFGMMPLGNISITNGNGQAQLEIKVLGDEKDLKVSTYLTKAPNEEWKLVEMTSR